VADIKAVFESAKDAGFHTKAIRHIVKERKVEKDKREAFEAVVDVYKHALGMLADLPLGEAAIKRDLPRQDTSAAPFHALAE
jgi:hypothetical protein